MMDISALRRDLDGLRIEDNAKIVQQKSRDFYWYSPVLKRQLDAVTGDLVVFRGRSWTELLSRPESDRIVIRDGRAIDRVLPDYSELDDLMV